VLNISPFTRDIANGIAECCAAKQVPPQDLRWGDFKKWLKETKGLDSAELRQVEVHVSSVGGYTTLRNAFFVAAATAGAVEKVQMQSVAKLARANVSALANDEVFLARFREVMEGLLREFKQYAPFGFAVKPAKEKTQRVVTLALSDLHFGSKLDPRELPYRYDFEEEARALSSVMVRLCEFKQDHRAESELVIWLGGDLIRGKIHDRQAGRAIAEQGADAMWLLTQAIRMAAGYWKRVTVKCSTGNHDREEARNPGRAFEETWDSRATLIYFGVKLAVADLRNVTVEIPRTPFVQYEPFGHRIYATHGDTNLETGNPAKAINISRLDQQMKTINLAEVQAGNKPFEAFLVGHIHQGIHLPLPVAHLVANPALIPADGYARGVGYPVSRSGQVLFETTPDHVIGDLRFLDVTPETLKDKALDKVLRPFHDF
jgi:hypothetical protein